MKSVPKRVSFEPLHQGPRELYQGPRERSEDRRTNKCDINPREIRFRAVPSATVVIPRRPIPVVVPAPAPRRGAGLLGRARGGRGDEHGRPAGDGREEDAVGEGEDLDVVDLKVRVVVVRAVVDHVVEVARRRRAVPAARRLVHARDAGPVDGKMASCRSEGDAIRTRSEMKMVRTSRRRG